MHQETNDKLMDAVPEAPLAKVIPIRGAPASKIIEAVQEIAREVGHHGVTAFSVIVHTSDNQLMRASFWERSALATQALLTGLKTTEHELMGYIMSGEEPGEDDT